MTATMKRIAGWALVLSPLAVTLADAAIRGGSMGLAMHVCGIVVAGIVGMGLCLAAMLLWSSADADQARSSHLPGGGYQPTSGEHGEPPTGGSGVVRPRPDCSRCPRCRP